MKTVAALAAAFTLIVVAAGPAHAEVDTSTRTDIKCSVYTPWTSEGGRINDSSIVTSAEVQAWAEAALSNAGKLFSGQPGQRGCQIAIRFVWLPNAASVLGYDINAMHHWSDGPTTVKDSSVYASTGTREQVRAYIRQNIQNFVNGL